jgi:hypothetical protein
MYRDLHTTHGEDDTRRLRSQMRTVFRLGHGLDIEAVGEYDGVGWDNAQTGGLHKCGTFFGHETETHGTAALGLGSVKQWMHLMQRNARNLRAKVVNSHHQGKWVQKVVTKADQGVCVCTRSWAGVRVVCA